MKNRKPMLQSRTRKVDLNALDVDQLMVISATIGKETAKIMKEAQAKIQAMLDVYDMQLVLKYNVVPKAPVEVEAKAEETEG